MEHSQADTLNISKHLHCLLSTMGYNTTLTNNNGEITIIHPFLPNKGKTYTCLRKIKLNGKFYLKCMDDSDRIVNIPIEYTDYDGYRIERECDFLFKDLMNLFDLIESIKKVYTE